MRHFEDVVVGSGAGGLTAAVLLAATGRKVLLIEKAPKIGGSLPRFFFKGVPFDTGFHFTGGFGGDGLADDMFEVLGIREDLVVQPVTTAGSNRFIFEREGLEYAFPAGVEQLVDALKGYFPGEAAAIDRYMQMCEDVCRRTGGMRLSSVAQPSEMQDEDFIALSVVLDDLTDDRHLKALLGGYAMCYGSKPCEISFANHARVCWNLYQSVSRIDRGGDAIVRAFRRRLKELGVETMTRRWVVECADVEKRHVGRLVLNDGEEIAFENCVWAIHPKAMVEALPQKGVSPAFRHRVGRFESSTGFFATYGVAEGPATEPTDEYSIVSLFPSTDVDCLLEHEIRGDSAIVVLSSPGEAPKPHLRPVCTLEPARMEDVTAWQDSSTGNRPAAYMEYKAARVRRTQDRLARTLPGLAADLTVLRSATALTYRDYLNSPDGSAYGVRQKMGQINVFGRLPIRNMYAAGQSSLLPGVLGAMMSSFMVVRQMRGKDVLDGLLAGRVAR